MCLSVSGGICDRPQTFNFHLGNETYMTVLTGDTAVLKCAVNNVGPKSSLKYSKQDISLKNQYISCKNKIIKRSVYHKTIRANISKYDIYLAL